MPAAAALVLIAGCGGSAAAPLPGIVHADALVPAAPARLSARYRRTNPIDPRYQWNHNYGYCGEVSFISAGLYYGQYLSQYAARAAAGNVPQNRYRSQLLLGVNDERAAAAMHLVAAEFPRAPYRSTDEFLSWVKQNVALGRPVAIGIYMNQYRFYRKPSRSAGSKQYDHIVPVIGVASHRPPSEGGYSGSDALTFSDNGEWGHTWRSARYLYTYAFDRFQRTREQANGPNGPIYSISNHGSNFGVAILGVADGDRETLPVRVTTSVNYEHPEIAQGSSRRPAPEPLTLTVTVSGLKRGTTYNLYRYDRLDAVPDRAFNAHAGRAYEKWLVDGNLGPTFSMTEQVESDEIAAYRAVPTDAP